ncbi:MAG: GNAT family N-acetyltransferase [Lentihominibacter sp.]|nr:GNAT family N-acetyltransferase [Lentihominibacter sp.]
MSRGIRPCWDAANEISLHMALKLGYEYNGEYSTVHLIRPEAAGTR